MFRRSKNADLSAVQITPKSHRRLFLIILALLVLAATVVSALYVNDRRKKDDIAKIAFTINDRKYSKADYEKVRSQPQNKDISADKFKEAYIALEKMKFAAEKVDINIDAQELNKKAKNILQADFKDLSMVLQRSVYEQALPPYLESSSSGDFAGYVFVFPFEDKIPQEGIATRPPGYGDNAGIEQDRKYAKEQAEHYYQQIKQNKMNNSQVLDAIKKEPKLRYYNAPNDSLEFKNTALQPWDLAVPYQLVDTIKNYKQTGLKDIQTIKIENNETKQMVDSRYYFVNMTHIGKVNKDARKQYDEILSTVSVKEYF